jgi:subtilase family serine protease
MRRIHLRVEELESRNLLSVFSPVQIRHAYGFDQISFGNGKVQADGSGQTIAIVEAFHDPQITSDLHYFDRRFGLPDPSKFLEVDQNGGNAFPALDPVWSLETAMDVEWAHAIAPRANILLVEANSSTFADFLTAVNFARYQPGVVVVSMSWGSTEFPSETGYDAYFTTPRGHIGGSGLPGGITFVASTGDSGAGTSYPAVSPNVLAVGGTSLVLGPSGNYVSEKAWNGSGGGLSLYESKPIYQLGVAGGKRSTPDVALNADPYTGYYIYDTVPYSGISGWFQDAGTSAAAPEWAALIALADQGRALAGRGSLANAQSFIYNLPARDFHDITSGSNGYAAAPGYDLVTGRGTPNAKLVVQNLLSAGTLSVMPVMARSEAIVSQFAPHLKESESSVGSSLQLNRADESIRGVGFVTPDIPSIQAENQLEAGINRAPSVSVGSLPPSLTLWVPRRNNFELSESDSMAKSHDMDSSPDWFFDSTLTIDAFVEGLIQKDLQTR